MKEAELRSHAICNLCRRKIGETGLPVFWTVQLVRYGIRLDAVSRQNGLAQMLNGNALLAMHMGADEDMTIELCRTDITVCEDCAAKDYSVWQLGLREEAES